MQHHRSLPLGMEPITYSSLSTLIVRNLNKELL